MNADTIREGLIFASKNNLTKREMEVLLQVLDEPKSNQAIADSLGNPKSTIHHLLMRLKLKKLIDIKDRDDNGTNIYEVTIK